MSQNGKCDNVERSKGRRREKSKAKVAGDNLHLDGGRDKAELECLYEEGLRGIDGFSEPEIIWLLHHHKMCFGAYEAGVFEDGLAIIFS